MVKPESHTHRAISEECTQTPSFPYGWGRAGRKTSWLRQCPPCNNPPFVEAIAASQGRSPWRTLKTPAIWGTSQHGQKSHPPCSGGGQMLYAAAAPLCGGQAFHSPH